MPAPDGSLGDKVPDHQKLVDDELARWADLVKPQEPDPSFRPWDKDKSFRPYDNEPFRPWDKDGES